MSTKVPLCGPAILFAQKELPTEVLADRHFYRGFWGRHPADYGALNPFGERANRPSFNLGYSIALRSVSL